MDKIWFFVGFKLKISLGRKKPPYKNYKKYQLNVLNIAGIQLHSSTQLPFE